MTSCLNILYEPQVFLPSAAFIVVILLVWAQLNATTPRQLGDSNQDGQKPTLILGFIWLYVAVLVALAAFALYVFEYRTLATHDISLTTKLAVSFFALSFLMTAAHVGGSILEKLCRYCTGQPIGELVNSKKGCLFVAALLTGLGLAFISFSLVDLAPKQFLLIGFLMVLPAVIGIIVLFFMALRTGTSKTVNSKEEDCGKIAAAIIAIWMLLCSIKTTLNKKHD